MRTSAAIQNEKREQFSKDEIAELLSRTGMSQRAFARAVGVHRNTVSNWLAGRKSPQGLSLVMLENLKSRLDNKEPIQTC